MAIDFARLKTVAFLILAAQLPSLAYAQAWNPGLRELRATMPGIDIRPADKGGGWILGEWRESELKFSGSGFSLQLYWNGLDDKNWPFERIVAALSNQRCGPVSASVVKRQVGQLYKTKSLIPRRDIGGNGGETFRLRLNTRLGTCAASYLADGARWHSLSVSVSSH